MWLKDFENKPDMPGWVECEPAIDSYSHEIVRHSGGGGDLHLRYISAVTYELDLIINVLSSSSK